MSNLPDNEAPSIDEVTVNEQAPTEQDGEVYARQAKGSDGVARPWNERERYMLFARGWREGAAARPMNIGMKGLGAYDNGYAAGKKAANEAIDAYAKSISYTPSLLRVDSVTITPRDPSADREPHDPGEHANRAPRAQGKPHDVRPSRPTR